MNLNVIGKIRIEKVKKDDLEVLHNLNQTNLPHVSSISLNDLDKFYKQAVYFRVAKVNKRIIGFLIALGVDAEYESPNYNWFKVKYDSFIYIDRVIIAPQMRRKGIATILYNDLETYARKTNIPIIVCEYNIEPKNEESRLFHQKYGFHEAGMQYLSSVDKKVSFQIKQVE